MFNHICLGGTFDHLHAGHKKFIKEAFLNGRKVTIGLASKEIIKSKKFKHSIETYDNRKANLINFINQSVWIKDFSVIALTSIYGSTLRDSSIDAILVTKETLKNGRKINKERIILGLRPLSIVVAKYLKSSSNKVIRSERIRAGKINTLGENFASEILKLGNLRLPHKLRSKLQHPLGIAFEGDEHNMSKCALNITKYIKTHTVHFLIGVGDVACQSLTKQGVSLNLKIVDGKTQRKKIETPIESDFQVRNPPGQIRTSAVRCIKKTLKMMTDSKNLTIKVSGEEDLLALPVILLSPLETFVFYGQKDVGIILVKVTLELKKEVMELLKQFEGPTLFLQK